MNVFALSHARFHFYFYKLRVRSSTQFYSSCYTPLCSIALICLLISNCNPSPLGVVLQLYSCTCRGSDCDYIHTCELAFCKFFEISSSLVCFSMLQGWYIYYEEKAVNVFSLLHANCFRLYSNKNSFEVVSLT